MTDTAVAVTTVENGRTLATITQRRYPTMLEWNRGTCAYPTLLIPRTTFISRLRDEFLETMGYGPVYQAPIWTRCDRISVWTSPKTRKEYCGLHADASGRLT